MFIKLCQAAQCELHCSTGDVIQPSAPPAQPHMAVGSSTVTEQHHDSPSPSWCHPNDVLPSPPHTATPAHPAQLNRAPSKSQGLWVPHGTRMRVPAHRSPGSGGGPQRSRRWGITHGKSSGISWWQTLSQLNGYNQPSKHSVYLLLPGNAFISFSPPPPRSLQDRSSKLWNAPSIRCCYSHGKQARWLGRSLSLHAQGWGRGWQSIMTLIKSLSVSVKSR